MKLSKLLLFVFVFIAVFNQDLFSMVAGGSRLYRNFIEALNKPRPDASHLSDMYYEIENESEQEEALKQATIKNINIVGQEDLQKNIKKQLLKSEQSQAPKLTKLQEFERDLKIKATRSSLEKSIKQFSGQDLERALELAAQYNIIFPEYPQQRQFTSKSDQFSDDYDKLLIEADLQDQKNRDAKQQIQVRLSLSELLQDKKEELKKVNKNIAETEKQLKDLSGQSDIKSSRADGLLRSQNTQLKNQNETLMAQLEKLQNRLQEIKVTNK